MSTNDRRHLIKLFDSIASLNFADSKNEEKKVALGMLAKDGEYVKFNEDCNCNGPVSKNDLFVYFVTEPLFM